MATYDHNVQTVDSVADLANVEPVHNQLVQTLGYHTAGDGGGNLYQYDAASVVVNCDGGSILDGLGGDNSLGASAASYAASGTGRFFPVNQNVISAKQFGAYGDGMTQSDKFRLDAGFARANIVFDLEGFTYVCYGLTIDGAGATVRSTGATLLHDSAQLASEVVTFGAGALVEGRLNVDLDGNLLTDHAVKSNGAGVQLDTISVTNANITQATYYAFNVQGGSLVADAILTNAAGYAGLNIGGTTTSVVVGFVQSVNYFYKGVRFATDGPFVHLKKVECNSTYGNAGMEGVLVDAGVSGNELQHLKIDSLTIDGGATANFAKFDIGTINVTLGDVQLRDTNGNTSDNLIQFNYGKSIRVGSVTAIFSTYTGTNGITLDSPVELFSLESFLFDSASDSFVVTFDGGASGTMRANIGSVVVLRNTKTNGFLRLEGFAGQTLHAEIDLLDTPDQRPINRQVDPANVGPININRLVGYTGSNWTGAVANDHNLRIRGEFVLTATPTAGTYAVGERLRYFAPVAAGDIGEVCTTGGTPGTWKPYGPIDA